MITPESGEQNDSPFETSLNDEDLIESPNMKNGEEIINKLMEDSISDDIPAPTLTINSDNESVHNSDNESVHNSDNESSDDSSSEDEIEMDSITTKTRYGGRELAIHREDDNKIYDPDTSDLLGKLIIVTDPKAPISDNDNDCIVGESIEISENTYLKCSLTNRVYDIDSHELIGLANKKQDVWTLRKTKKKK